MAKKTDCTLNNLRLSASALAVASCLALSGLPLVAHAAGLGKVTVFSALGQPLRAEVELSASREELSGMRAQLASQEAFKQAGLDFPMTLTGIKFAIDKNANGQSIIKLSSDRPINDPFVDMLLELNWPSGRLVREYTFLLDPPEVTAKAAAQVTPVLTRPVVPAPAKPVVPSKPLAETRISVPLEDKPPARPEPAAKPRVQEQAKEAAPAADATQRDVKRGDTLRKIASETKAEGVSLDQMLVGLFRANPEAFESGNMNRLKSGKILTIPDKSSLEAVSDSEAKKIIVAQSSDWNAYRRKLAGIIAQTSAKEDTGKQESSGKITAKVEDKAAPAAERKDQVKVSRTEIVDAKLGAAAKRSEEDLIAKERALKEANDRLASLEKNVADLQKLVELKNQNLADLQKQAAAKAAVPVEVKKPEPEIKPQAAAVSPVVAPTPVKTEPAPPVVAAVVKPIEIPAEVKPEAEKPEVKPVPTAEEMPKPKPKPLAPPPLPVEEPSFVDDLLDDPILLAGGGGILALLAGFLVYKRRRQNALEKPLTTSSTLAPTTDSLVDNSVFRSTGGQSVDTSQTPAQTDFSQAGPGSIDTDEVDPVAEADVYMAYGRDAQAEEILLEAKQKDSKRYAIHLKLLEIYLNRKNLKQFESLATDLYSETGGIGAEWEKAAAMGLKLDPQNPLYGGTAQATAKSFDPDATVVVSQQNHSSTITMPAAAQSTEAASAISASTSSPETPVAQVAIEEPAELMSLDFDLGMSDEKTTPPPATHRADLENTVTLPETGLGNDDALDFDIGTSPTASQTANQVDETVAGLDFDLPEIGITEPAPAAETANDLDFDLGFDISPEPVLTAEPSADTSAINLLDIDAVDDGALEFDIQLSESTVLGQPMHESSFDMSSISLDLAEVAPLEQAQSPALDELIDLPLDTGEMNFVAPPDFSIEEPAAVVDPQFSADFDSEFGSAQELDITPSEEVATKLDLAKAYEEMGDLEGARELLQEVIKEGDATQQEKAQVILAKIGD